MYSKIQFTPVFRHELSTRQKKVSFFLRMHEMLLPIGWLIFLFQCTTNPSVCIAQDSRYQDLLLGHRAIGLGGAYTALVDDSLAAIYNPAGIAFMKRPTLSMNLTLYGVEFRRRTQGFRNPRNNTTAELESTNFPILPITTGFSSLFGAKDKTNTPEWAAAFTLMLPANHYVLHRQGLSDKNFQNSFTLHRSDYTYSGGPTIAKRWKNFSIGLSALYIHRSYLWLFSQAATNPICPNETPCPIQQADHLSSHVQGWVGLLAFRIGLRYDFSSRIRMGLSVGLPSIRLWGRGSILMHRFSSSSTNSSNSIGQFISRENLKTNYSKPWTIRLGTAWNLSSSVLLSIDGVWYAPNQYTLLEVNPSQEIGLQRFPLFQYPRNIQRRMVANIHCGLEWKILHTIFLRFGIYSNFSSSPNQIDIDCKSNACLEQIHMLGLSTSLGIPIENHFFDFGINVSFGRGHGQRIVQQQEIFFERIPNQHLFAYVFVSGIGHVLTYALQKILKTLKNVSLKKKPLLHNTNQYSVLK